MNNDTDININNNDGNKQHNISDENEEKEILKEESNKDDDNDKECLLFELGNYLNKYKSIKPKKRNHAFFENDVIKFYDALLISKESDLKDNYILDIYCVI